VRVERAARQHRLIAARRGMRPAPPHLHELDEILIDDLGAIESLVTGADG
jgi:hypothetical protein